MAAATLVQTDAAAQRFRDFHGRDFRRFTVEERRFWRSGHWLHEFHNGRYGWWWVVDGVWYYYPEPIFPFPTYVPAPEVVVNTVPAYPPPQYAPPPPPATVAAQPAVSWYYCDNPQGYFPYVQNCNVQWRQVPSAAPATQPTAPPPPPPPSR